MEFRETVERRRSIRKYGNDPVDEAVLTRILEAGRLAPSATNSQPWRFLVVRAPARREALAAASYGQKFLSEAPVVLAVLGDRARYRKRLRRGKELIDLGAIDPAVMEAAGTAYRKREAGGDDAAILLQCALAAEHLALAATAEGLGTCWVRLFDEEAVAAALALPDTLFPAVLLPVGTPREAPPPRPRSPLAEVACDETVDRPWGV